MFVFLVGLIVCLFFFLYDSLYKAFGKEINNTCKRYLKNLVVRFTNLPLVNTFQHGFFSSPFSYCKYLEKKKTVIRVYIYSMENCGVSKSFGV